MCRPLTTIKPIYRLVDKWSIDAKSRSSGKQFEEIIIFLMVSTSILEPMIKHSSEVNTKEFPPLGMIIII